MCPAWYWPPPTLPPASAGSRHSPPPPLTANTTTATCRWSPLATATLLTPTPPSPLPAGSRRAPRQPQESQVIHAYNKKKPQKSNKALGHWKAATKRCLYCKPMQIHQKAHLLTSNIRTQIKKPSVYKGQCFQMQLLKHRSWIHMQSGIFQST